MIHLLGETFYFSSFVIIADICQNHHILLFSSSAPIYPSANLLRLNNP